MGQFRKQIWEVWRTDHREERRPATAELVGRFEAKGHAQNFIDNAYRAIVNKHAPGQIVYELRETYEMRNTPG